MKRQERVRSVRSTLCEAESAPGMMGEVIRVSGRPTDAADLLREAMFSQRFADVTLCCPGGQRFLAHRLVLSAASPYLQDVLLAHSKCSACEPTTVILAEVEAPELAAILAFVYTGSAAVPRARLHGFLRAAEALRIRLPPIPPVVLDGKAEDLKLGPEYLECRQFPRCQECCPAQLYRREEEVQVQEEEEYVDVTGFDQDQEKPATPKGFDVGDVGVGARGMGEDLSSREVCCDWRKVKRRVANRVTASPWRQIVRVHHSPRVQRTLHHQQNHDDETILSARVPVIERIVNEAPAVAAASFDFPSKAEGNFCSPEPPAASTTFLVDDPLNIRQRTPAKLSHPVSRLCDTLDREEKPAEVLAERSDEEHGNEEKIPSDSNNNNKNNDNDATIPMGITSRGKLTQEEHKCEECGKSFVTRASLKVHSRTHTGEKPFRCADCGKEFSQLRNYKYHRSVHEGTREFAATCPECGKYFNDRGYLSSHMKIHRNRKEYGCAECGKSFNQRVAYNMHVRIHTGVKPHQCEQCGKAFSRKMLLKQHLRTHSGERPYQCQVCHKAFADRSNMTLHTRLHSGLKPYQCTLCSKAFTKKHHLKTHLNYHTGTKPYSCANCGLRFSQSSNMRTHFKKCTLNNPEGGLKPERKERKERNDVALTPPNSDQESSIITSIVL